MIHKFLILLLLVSSVKSALSANILYIAPIPSPSHHVWNRALAVGLANKGYNVTYISPDEDKLPKPKNYTPILLEDCLPSCTKKRELGKKVFGEDVQSFAEIERHISLVLANTDPILDYPQPVPPNIIPVGGLHTRKPKEIPKEWLTVLENAKNGVIVFSLGTNIRSDKLPIGIQKEMLKAFRQLPQTVIWKFESTLEDIPENVIISKWLPQNDILSHPNVKLFIGHGGTLSTQETFYHGVPMIVVPFMFDQYINSRMVVDKKLGISVDFRKITADYFLGKIKEVLDNTIYL